MSVRRSAMFSTIRTEGGILPPALLERVARADSGLRGLTPADYHLAKGERLGEATNRSWLRLTGAWAGFRTSLAASPPGDPAMGLTREHWLLILFAELGYGRLQPARALAVDGHDYPVSHHWGNAPIHLVGAGVDLDRRTAGVAGAARSSPHSMVQELLNRSPERLWGFLSNGLRLRILRDNASLTRQAYVEFDLEAMMDGEIYSDFAVLWLLCHQSRVETEDLTGCWLERWSTEARVQGARALEHLRDGVEAAIKSLGTGFLRHPSNRPLTDALTNGTVRDIEYYRQLLRVVYRLLFLLVAEDRNLLHPPGTNEETRHRYHDYYSMSRLRELCERRRGGPHTDLWAQLRIVIDALGNPSGLPELGLPALGGFLFSTAATPALDTSQIANADLLEALRHLSGRNDDGRGYRWRFDYRNLGVEELGSVYESLLELHPEVNVPAGLFTLMTGGKERRSTGSHYTPPPILKKVLDFALDPVIARAAAQKEPAKALLDLRVLDPAAGSGHFLIAAAHRIARAVATARTGEPEPSPEAVRAALRDVVARCVYGVDLNPMAVELCKVALWLETLQPGKPLGFLDHHIRTGNSLLGVPLSATVTRNRAAVDAARKNLEDRVGYLEAELRGRPPKDPETDTISKELRARKKELADTVYDSWTDAVPDAAFKPTGHDDRDIARKVAATNKRQRKSGQLTLANLLVELPDDIVAEFDKLGDGAEDTAAEVTIRAEVFAGAQRRAEYQQLLLQANTWTAAWFWPMRPEMPPAPTQSVFATLATNVGALPADTAHKINREATDRRLFHFELAFPEVFSAERGGFDVVIGNPPYLGGMKISTTYGDKFLAFLKHTTSDVATGGRVDLAAYFLRRAYDLLRPNGEVCFITTNTIAEGDTREAGLLQLVSPQWGGEIVNAVRNERWEGEATVNVAIVHVHRGPWPGLRSLDGQAVDSIRSDLSIGDEGEPDELRANEQTAPSVGTNIIGEGFILSADERRRLLEDDPENAKVIKSFIGGRQAVQAPDPGRPQRWVIDFGDLSLDGASRYPEPLQIVRNRVKPQRDKVNRASYRERWWRFAERSARLYERIEAAGIEKVIAIPHVSKAMLPVFLPTGVVYQDKLFVFPSESPQLFAELSSSFHWLWTARRCTTMRVDPNYNPVHFKTFPRPAASTDVASFGELLHSHRLSMMIERNEGVTQIYSRVTDGSNTDDDVAALRDIHQHLDDAIAAAYGWEELVGVSHGPNPHDRFGVRVWLPESDMQREIERLLLTLNRERTRASVAT